jgi:hypothetical protein
LWFQLLFRLGLGDVFDFRYSKDEHKWISSTNGLVEKFNTTLMSMISKSSDSGGME